MAVTIITYANNYEKNEQFPYLVGMIIHVAKDTVTQFTDALYLIGTVIFIDTKSYFVY